MKSKLALSFLALSGVAMVPCLSFAGAKAAQDKSESMRTLTGCLSRGDKAGEYDLRADDGSTWEVRGDGVPLADHVGQTVSVTGAVKNTTAHNLKEDAKDVAQDAHMKKSNTEHGHMTVTDVQKVSDTCQK
jgi:hypothetical protein